jgi:hypothetical protein
MQMLVSIPKARANSERGFNVLGCIGTHVTNLQVSLLYTQAYIKKKKTTNAKGNAFNTTLFPGGPPPQY